MQADTIQFLLELNRQFYQTFAAPFSATRQRLQSGVQRILAEIPATARVLDLGCGNGEVWQRLAQKGHQGAYVGLDFSPGLLEDAQRKAGQNQEAADPQENDLPEAAQRQALFLPVDLSAPDWEASIPPPSYDAILAFAVLHHLPARDLRQQVLQKVRRLLSPGGRFYHSEWQFMNSPRLRERVQPWESVKLAAEKLEPDDYLLDWRQGGLGLRYVHLFSEEELAEAAQDAGFRVIETFISDGKNGKLGLYQVWELIV